MGLASAYTFDDIKNYDEAKKQVTIKNAFGLGDTLLDAQLNTPQTYTDSLFGNDRLVGEIKINTLDKSLTMPEILSGMNFIDMKKGEVMQKTYSYKLKVITGQREIPEQAFVCPKDYVGDNRKCPLETIAVNYEDIVEWKPIKDLSDLPDSKEPYIIGIFTDVRYQEAGDWIANLYGKDIPEWAFWNESFSSSLFAVFPLNDTGGGVFNILNRSLNGTQGGSVTYNQSGVYMNATMINGTNAQGYFDIAATSELTNRSFTFSVWTKLGHVNGVQRVWESDQDVQGSWTMRTNGARLGCGGLSSGGGYECDSGSFLVANRWYLFTCTWNQTSKVVTIYINGTQICTSTATGTNFANNRATNRIGGDTHYTLIQHLNATLDELYIWNDTKTPAFISQLYDSAAGTFYGNFSPTATDDEYPQFSAFWDNNGSLRGSGNAYFNVTVTSTNATVLLEINGANYSASNLSSTLFNKTLTTLTAGTYPYRWHSWGNGTSHNYNQSGLLYYTVNISNPVNISFVSQLPSDIDTNNSLRGVNITYQFLNGTYDYFTSYNVVTKVNSTSSDCFSFVNGSNFKCGFSSLQNQTTNISNQNLTFQVDHDFVYPASYNYNPEVMETTAKSDQTLSAQSQAVKIELLNMSNTKRYGFLWFNVQNISAASGTLEAYYCNSSYTTGSFVTSPSCLLIHSVIATDKYDITQPLSSYFVGSFLVNTTTGKVNNQIDLTSTSYFVLRGNTGGWNARYITDVARLGSAQTTVNTGTSWSNLAGSLDIHVHQFNGTETFYYFGLGKNSTGTNITTTVVNDLLQLAGVPPTTPIVISPTSANYSNNTVLLINYTKALSLNGYSIVNYTIDLFNSGNGFNKSIFVNVGENNLTYYWNLTGTLIGTYTIRVKATDNLSQVSKYGVSDLFNVSLPPTDVEYPQFYNISIIPTNNSEYVLARVYNFFTNVNSTNGTVFIQFNNTNYTMQNASTLFNRTLNDLPAGTYAYYFGSWNNGTAHNYNISRTFYYTISQNNSYVLNLGLSSNLVEYPTQTTATGSGCPSVLTCTLYRDGVSKSNPETITLGVGTYNYTYNTTGNTNYTSKSASSNLVVTVGNSTVNTYVNNTRNNINIVNGTSLWLNGTLVNGQFGKLNLTVNGVQVNTSTTGNVSYLYTFNTVGTYTINTTFTNSNYTSSQEIWTVTANSQAIGGNISLNYPTNGLLLTDNRITFNWTINNPNFNNIDNTTLYIRNSSNYLVSKIFYNLSAASTPIYGFSSGWFQQANLHDGNFNTYGQASILNQPATMYINYTKPQYISNNSLFRIKYGDSGTSVDNNYTIPISCFEQSILQFYTTSYMNSIGDTAVNAYCLNSTGVVTIFTSTYFRIYEHEMLWSYNNNQSQVNFSYYNNTLTDVLYTWTTDAGFSNGASFFYSMASNFTFNLGTSINNVTYNTSTLETSTETFITNYTQLNGILFSSADFYYNGTLYPSIINCNANDCTASNTIDIPLITNGKRQQNNSFYWTINTYSGSTLLTVNTSLYNQSVNYINMTYCLPNSLGTKTLNFTVYTEQNRSKQNFLFDGEFNYYTGSGAIYKNVNITNSSTPEMDLCIEPNATYYIDSIIAYGYANPPEPFTMRNWFHQYYKINETLQDIKMYSLESDLSTSFVLQVQDRNILGVPTVLIEVQKCYAGIGANETVFIARTNNNGLTVGNFEAETALYQFLITNKSNTLLEVTPCSPVVPQTTPYTILFQLGTPYSSPFLNMGSDSNVTSNMSFNRTTNTVVFTYQDTSGDFRGAELVVKSLNYSGNVQPIVCRSTLNISTGLLTCDVSDAGSYSAFAYIYRSTNALVDRIVVTVTTLASSLGYYGVFLGWFLILISAFTFKFNEIAGIWITTAMIIFVNMIGLVAFGNVAIAAILVIVTVITAVLER